MIFISDDLYIGEGNERRCFSYPNQAHKCVKITIEKVGVRQEQSIVEHDYYAFLESKNVPLTHIPKCYGWVETNLGKGLVFEKIESEKNKGVLSLKKALELKLVDVKDLKEMLEDIYNYLIFYGIALSDINSDNILVSLEKKRLYLVDGIGGRNFDLKYRIRKKSPFLSKYKTKRQWNKYYYKLAI